MSKWTGSLSTLFRRGLAIIVMLSMLAASAGCARGFSADLDDIVKPFRFSIPSWEVRTIVGRLFSLRFQKAGISEDVLRYFALSEQQRSLESAIASAKAGASNDYNSLNIRLQVVNSEKSALKPVVVQTLKNQIEETLHSQGIYSNFMWLKLPWPPISFDLATPPHTLAISPQDKVVLQDSILLQQDLSVDAINSIESRVDALGVSSLVLDLGGFGATYPTFVDDNGDLPFTIETAIHEWLHQYLAFKPLGFRYVLDGLGIHPDGDAVTINETLAHMVSQELVSVLLQKYYQQNEVSTGTTESAGRFNFDTEMRSIRKEVDALLAGGKVDEAEQYMEQKREFLLSKGYYIRKLNQAYFAFNDQYADTPASSNPIGPEMEALRARNPSLKTFLDVASRLTSRQELISALK
jgi:hypothetical protein